MEALWEITNFRDPTGPTLPELRAVDTTTDLGARFFFPAWGPLEVDLVGHVRSVVKVLDYSRPHLHLFKPGYRHADIRGPSEDPRPFLSQFHFKAEDTRDAWWDGRVITLEPDIDTVEQRRRNLSRAISALADCRWVRMPRIAAAYIKEERQLQGKGVLPLDPASARLLNEHCPEARHLLSSYLD